MSSSRIDYRPNVSQGSVADNYVFLQDYQQNQTPQSSLLRLSVASGNEKYFSTAKGFENRTDNVRIPPPRLTPVSVSVGNGVQQSTQATQSMKIDRQASISSDYFTISNQGAYKMNPR
jgi:hypothetical protein